VLAIDDALAAGATTLHFSPLGPDFAVRARVGGSVTELGTVSRSERDATLRRLEAEGVAHTYVTATSRGEKTTVFFRDRSSSPRALDDLSSDPSVAEAIRSALSRGAGAILVCGPPGHGTTTTLYAAVQELAAPDRIVTTVEHPIERLLEGVDQIEVDPARGGTYASVLHEVRFTDPDAVMVGDVFDRETAELALRDTSEGRLVLAGIHAPSAAGAIRRLTELGVEPRTVATSLDCIVAQRLVRTVCPSCRETYYASEDEFELLGLDDDEGPRLLARGTGCEECGGTGLLGRTAIFEILPLTDEIRELVADGSSPKKIQRAAVSGGMRTLRDEGVRLCLDGTTSVPELQRALGL
jgi:type II secretory ATPase GspE/PulE/Tfp pilus assembly ATPase PilB-like protein